MFLNHKHPQGWKENNEGVARKKLMCNEFFIEKEIRFEAFSELFHFSVGMGDDVC
jgi:hypothetical protein